MRRRLLRNALHSLFAPAVSTGSGWPTSPTEGLPLQRPVVIRWNEHQVPFIEAETDHDLAFAFGMVHQHLRAGQIALFKRFFYGRMSEMAGPLARDLDHAIRILDYGHAADAWEKRMPEETRAWVQAFVDGLNAYQERATAPAAGVRSARHRTGAVHLPRYSGRLALRRHRLQLAHLLPAAGAAREAGFATLWNRTLEIGEPPTASTRPDAPEGEFEDLLLNAPRSGSNSVAVAPHRSAGAALIANDPHLGLSLPNVWILAGLRSPSFHAVGLSIVGLPMLGLGRNPDLAWGGTNLRAASSDLYDVSKLPENQIETSGDRDQDALVAPARRKIRRCAFGPIISDAKISKCRGQGTIALRWVGHEPNDEMTCFMRCARARTPSSSARRSSATASPARTCFSPTVPAISVHILAVGLPIRDGFPEDDLVLDATDAATHWKGFAGVMDLPFHLNPKHGVLALGE